MRLLEAHNPDVSFDWSRLLKPGAAAAPAPPPGSSREERRRDRRDQRRGRPEPRPRGNAATENRATEFTESTEGRAAEFTEYAEYTESTEGRAADDTASREDRGTEYTEYTESSEDAHDGATEDTALSAPATSADAIAGAPISVDEPEPEPEPVEPEEPEEPDEPEVPLAGRFLRLGADGLARLRARYAEIRGRLDAREMPEGERAELFVRAERLNPDGWQTAEEVAQALEDYETVLESLRPFIGRPPRRRRL